jgi:hypothetical protein
MIPRIVKAVSIDQLFRNQERVGLRQEHQRIVDAALVIAVEIVVAETSVAGHVDAQHQQVAFSRQLGTDHRLDDRDCHAHRRRGLHLLEDVLSKAGFASGYLQVGPAGNAIDGL